MAKVNFSPNKKLNNILNDIYGDLIKKMGRNRKEAVEEIRRYKRSFPKEPDYNIAQYGNLLIYHGDIRNAYKKAGYGSTITKMSDEKLWDTYMRQVGYVARYIIDHTK